MKRAVVKDSVTIVIGVIVLLTLNACKPSSNQRQAFTIWLGSFHLNQTGLVLDVEVRWPVSYLSPWAIRPSHNTNNLFGGTEFETMPKIDPTNVVVWLSFSNCNSGVTDTHIFSNLTWHAMGYLLTTRPVRRVPGDTYRVRMGVTQPLVDSNMYGLHMWIAPLTRKRLWKKDEVAIVTTHCATVSAAAGEYRP